MNIFASAPMAETKEKSTPTVLNNQRSNTSLEVTTGFHHEPPHITKELSRSHPMLDDVDDNLSSSLFKRRAKKREEEPLGLTGSRCSRCREPFEAEEEIVSTGKEAWHVQCFLCAQCLRPFPEGIYFEYRGRNYCEHDFHVLYAPCCKKCDSFIVGRVIHALHADWHPHCFLCDLCQSTLAEHGFVKKDSRVLCRECFNTRRAQGGSRCICFKCKGLIDNDLLRFDGELYHAYHFNCKECGVELTSDARELKSELYCIRCHDKMGIPICGACRRPVEKRVVRALDKAWHPEHFVCAKCEKPFLGSKHWERKGKAYCTLHFHQLFGNICSGCDEPIEGDVFKALNKSWCTEHFCCSLCERTLFQKTKFYEMDMKPVCKICYSERLPKDLKKRLKLYHDLTSTAVVNPEKRQH